MIGIPPIGPTNRRFAFALAIFASACGFDSPSYEGTQFTCESSDDECPPGLSCVDRVCRPAPNGADTPDAGAPIAPDARPEPQPEVPDAAVPDAGPPAPVTVTIGDRTGADLPGTVRDGFMERLNPDTNFRSDVHVHIDADPTTIGLMRFDLAALPRDATVVSAELELVITNQLEDGVYRASSLLEDWDEDAVTYNQRRAGVPWAAPGAGPPASSAAIAAFEFAPRAEGPVTIPIPAALIQGWVSDPGSNFGIRIESVSPAGRGGNHSDRDAENAAERPLLRVVYQPR